MGKDLEDKISQVFSRKEQLEEQARQKMVDYNKRWDLYKVQQAAFMKEQAERLMNAQRKATWIKLIQVHKAVKDNIHCKFNIKVQNRKKLIMQRI